MKGERDFPIYMDKGYRECRFFAAKNEAAINEEVIFYVSHLTFDVKTKHFALPVPVDVHRVWYRNHSWRAIRHEYLVPQFLLLQGRLSCQNEKAKIYDE